MTAKELIKLLKQEDPDSEVFAYLGAEEGWGIVPLGYGDAVIGNNITDNKSFVLIPVEVPEEYEKWE